MPKVETAGGGIFYERSGAGEPLLLIQGMGGSHRSWGEPFLAPLRESFDCVIFDNRGVGGLTPSEAPFTIAELAEDAAVVLDAVGFESAHLLGISMGGMVAQEMALAVPERIRTLTLGCSYCGGPGSQLMDPTDFAELAEAMASGDRDRVFRASWEVNLSPGFRAEASRYLEFEAMAAAVPVPRKTIELQLQAIFAHDTSPRLPSLELPTLVIHGSADRVLPPANGEQIASLIPGAELEILDEVGHMFWWEQPQRSADLLRGHARASA